MLFPPESKYPTIEQLQERLHNEGNDELADLLNLSDSDAIESDWRNVGRYLQKAFDSYEDSTNVK